MFEPEPAYTVIFDTIPITDFSNYAEEFVVRPPYQRKAVWGRQKRQALLDSLFRRFYVPRIVIREVRLNEENVVREVIDGQQRILTAQLFLADDLPLPSSLADLHDGLAGKRYSQLPPDLRRFVDRLSYAADVVKGIDDPRDADHQGVASEVFWRLQLGEPLTYMERAHARLSSLTRNFIVQYADDIGFDYDEYRPRDENPAKHRFFTLLDRKNDRMQHLALLARLLMLEDAGGPTDLADTKVGEFIDAHQTPDGIGSLAYEETPVARATLATMNAFYETFKDDPMHAADGSPMKEFRQEYFIVSIYLLLRHLRAYYVFDADERKLFYDFLLAFYERWRSRSEDDNEILNFSDHRQQSGNDIETRHRQIRQFFFEFASAQGHQMLTKDERRAFSELERILVYRRDKGLCQACLAEGKPELEARVAWSEYETDHVVPHARGGMTEKANAQVLCGFHNAQKGAKVVEPARRA